VPKLFGVLTTGVALQFIGCRPAEHTALGETYQIFIVCHLGTIGNTMTTIGSTMKTIEVTMLRSDLLIEGRRERPIHGWRH
jgi:hypothetical protein